LPLIPSGIVGYFNYQGFPGGQIYTLCFQSLLHTSLHLPPIFPLHDQLKIGRYGTKYVAVNDVANDKAELATQLKYSTSSTRNRKSLCNVKQNVGMRT
jgi:hypothetical protein